MPSSLSRDFFLTRWLRIAADPDVRFFPWVQCPATHAVRQERKAAKRVGPVETGPLRRLSRGLTLFGESTADVFASISHVIRLGITRGAASVITSDWSTFGAQLHVSVLAKAIWPPLFRQY